MPNLIGMPADLAQKVVTASGLGIGPVTQQVSVQPVGTVASQSPAQPGGVAYEGDIESIAISLGGVAVPDLYLLDPSIATNELNGAGLVPVRSADTFTLDPDEVKKVRTQTPGAGSVVSSGTVVHFSVGKFDNR